jgi:hypothetical protein
LDSSIIQGPFSVAPCQTLANITIRNFFIAVVQRREQSRIANVRISGGRSLTLTLTLTQAFLRRPPISLDSTEARTEELHLRRGSLRLTYDIAQLIDQLNR